MNIAWVVPGGVDRSGTHRVIPVLLWLLERTARRHNVVVVALAQESEPAEWALCGARVINIGRRPRRWGAVRALLREQRARRFDLVQAFWAGGPGGAAALFAAIARIPLFVHVAGVELIGLPDIGLGGDLRRRSRWEVGQVLRRAAAVTTASQPMIELIARRAGRAAELLPLGVDREEWPPQPAVGRRPGEALRLVHVGSLNHGKDQTTLIHACERLARSGLEFTVDSVGEDTMGGMFQRDAAARGLTQIRWHGFLTQAELRPIVRAAHLSLVTSRHEAGPVALAEAAMCGVPTVGTAVGHVAELAPEAAVAVPVRDAAALASAIRALADDDARRVRLGAAAQSWALRHDAEWTFTTLDALYGRVLAERR